MVNAKLRYNRRWIAEMAVSTLVPMVRKDGVLQMGNGVQPSFRTLDLQGLRVILCENVLLWPDENFLCSLLDVFWHGNGGRKVLSVEFAPSPLIRCFHGGEWVQTLIDIQLTVGEQGYSPPPRSDTDLTRVWWVWATRGSVERFAEELSKRFGLGAEESVLIATQATSDQVKSTDQFAARGHEVLIFTTPNAWGKRLKDLLGGNVEGAFTADVLWWLFWVLYRDAHESLRRR